MDRLPFENVHRVAARLHCRECLAFTVFCPACGEPHTCSWAGSDGPVDAFLNAGQGGYTSTRCGCGAQIEVTLYPELEVPTPDPRALLERAWLLPSDPEAPRQPSPTTGPPAGGERRRLSHWADLPRGLSGITAASIAAAYRRLWGVEPQRVGPYRAYSREELAHIAAHLQGQEVGQ